MKKHRIGIVGTGFIARGLMLTLRNNPYLEVSKVLTRRPLDSVNNFPLEREKLTRDAREVIEASDLVVECSGDVIHGTDVVLEVFKAGLPVVTMNSELQTVSGTELSKLGTLLEAEGDQPGSLAALDLEIKDYGFEPLVYGNIKRFLNLNPNNDEMAYWSKRQGISLDQVTAFTDGTKVQIEQALVANGLGATILCRNLSGISCAALEDGAFKLAEMAEGLGRPVSDYVLCATAPAGIFIVAKHMKEQAPYLEYLKLGKGPYYVILKPYHLCHLEIPKTITNYLEGNRRYTFNNGHTPSIQVVAVTKRKIAKGEHIRRGLGGFDVRGEAVKIKNFPNVIPIGLLQDASVLQDISEGSVITYDQVAIQPSNALALWKKTLGECMKRDANSYNVL